MGAYDEVVGVYEQGGQTFRVFRFCTCNDRPVMFVETENGGMDAVVYDWKKGNFKSDTEYIFKVMEPGKDVEDMTQEEFESYVEVIRRQTPPTP